MDLIFQNSVKKLINKDIEAAVEETIEQIEAEGYLSDEDGNYVVWGTPTAEQLVEDNPNTYKSVPSEEDTRGKKEKIQLWDLEEKADIMMVN